uniref:Ubiquitin-like protease family profile domain-containing protein n=1 Tax=Aegilops tauschii TaxID=37682 RepID=M8C0G7_AEGTA
MAWRPNMAFNSHPKKLGRFHTDDLLNMGVTYLKSTQLCRVASHGASKMETTVKSAANGEKHVSEMTDEEILRKHGHMKLVCSPSTLAKVIKLFSSEHIEKIISDTGLGCLNMIREFKLRRIMRIRLAKSLDSETSSITIGPYRNLTLLIKYLYREIYLCFQVVMEICARQPEANNRKDPGSQKFVRVDEGDSSRAQSQGQNMSSHQVEMIVAALNARCAEQEKKIGRQLMEFQHRFYAKFLTLSEELIDIKSKSGSNPRLSLLEDEIKDLRRELKEQVNVCSDPFMATPKFDASTPRTSTPTPSARHVLPNKDDPRITLMQPLFDNDYVLTAEDKEAAIFIRGTHGPVEVVQIGDIPLRAEQLKPIYDKKYICGDVSPLLLWRMLTSAELRLILPQSYPPMKSESFYTKGVIPKGRGSSWVLRIANKFVGRGKVHIPLNVNDNHWMAMVFNFDKEEIQILNSLKNRFDESKETALVEAIQACMDEAVKDGLVTPAKPIKFTDWEVVRYDDIPQQNEGHSCAFFTLKYMLTWNGEVFTDKVEQTATYEAHVASQPTGSEDDVQEIIGTVECKISDTSSSPKDPDTPSSPKNRRGCGRSRKLVDEVQAKKSKTMEELRVKFDSKTIAKQVASLMSRRSRKPSQAISSPFKLTKW